MTQQVGIQRFPAEAASVPKARRFAAEAVEQSQQAWLVGLLVSELATNAVEHARSHFQVRVWRDDRRVRVEVSDADARRPLVRRVPLDAPGGRGMLIVDQFAERWGVDPTGAGKSVWFELSLAAASNQ